MIKINTFYKVLSKNNPPLFIKREVFRLNHGGYVNSQMGDIFFVLEILKAPSNWNNERIALKVLTKDGICYSDPREEEITEIS